MTNRDKIIHLMNKGKTGDALRLAMRVGAPAPWVQRITDVLVEESMKSLIPIEGPDVPVVERERIMKELKAEKAKRTMTRKEARQKSTKLLRRGLEGVQPIIDEYGMDVLTVNAKKKYDRLMAKRRAYIISEYRSLLDQDPEMAHDFRVEHDIKDKELNKWK